MERMPPLRGGDEPMESPLNGQYLVGFLSCVCPDHYRNRGRFDSVYLTMIERNIHANPFFSTM